jgi:succinate dehydrogenase/fumarate reductase flavoprotein subunit
MISRAIVQEIEAGRGYKGPYGDYVHLDLTHLGGELIDKRLPMVRELSKVYAGVDPVYEPIPIRPVVHYMMGGVDTDIDGATTLPGLYAAGETACVSLNGANRLGSNSLTECLVFGARAGRVAVEYAAGTDAGDDAVGRSAGEDESGRLAAARAGAKKGNERLAQLRRELNQTMEAGCGVYREQASMDETVRTVAQLKQRMSDVRLEDASAVFNTELVAALELDNMLEVAESLAVSAAHRRESRGAHTRRDAPKRDDQNFLYHTLCYYGSAGPRLGKKPVTLGKWVPEERKY